jgi:hypothetical protein
LKPLLLKHLLLSLKFPQRRQPPRPQPLHQDQLSRVEPLRANQHVMRHVRLLALLLHAPTRHVQMHSVLRLLVHLVSLLLDALLVRRLVVRSAQLVVRFRRLLVVP